MKNIKRINAFLLMTIAFMFIFTSCNDAAGLDDIGGLVGDGLNDLGGLVENGMDDLGNLVDSATGNSSGSGGSTGGSSASNVTVTSGASGTERNSAPSVLTPSADGVSVFEGTSSVIDMSNSDKGYIMVKYTGTPGKVKMQLSFGSDSKYTYDLSSDGEYETFPLVKGSGSYTVTINKNITGTSYAVVDTVSFDATITDSLSPFLYPNQYVDFNTSSNIVSVASDLATGATSDLEVVERIYNYIITNIVYDYDKAATVASGYLPVVDETLATGKGICFDYAAVMAGMLRSQNIPTQLVIGYAGSTYHSWVSIYTPETGWIYNMFEFDGSSWVRMDPTFASSNDNNDAILKYIGDGTNYNAMYFY